MAKQRYVNTRFWSDNFIRENLNPLDRYLFLYFLTNEKTNISGIYELPISTICSETGIEKEMLLKMMKRLEGKINYVDGWVWLVNFQKHQNTKSPKIKAGIEAEMAYIPQKIREFIEYGYPMDTLSHSNSNSNSNINSNSNSNLTIGVETPTPKKRREDIDELLEGIKEIVKVIDGSKMEQRNFAKNFLDSKTPEILRQSGNLNPTKEQIINATLRLFQLASKDSFHSKNCTSLKYVYNKAGAIVMATKSNQSNEKKSWIC